MGITFSYSLLYIAMQTAWEAMAKDSVITEVTWSILILHVTSCYFMLPHVYCNAEGLGGHGKRQRDHRVNILILHVTSVITLSFAMAYQAFCIAIYSGEYEKVFPTKSFLVSKMLKLLLTGKITASPPPLKQKKERKKGWEGLSSVIIFMTALLHLTIWGHRACGHVFSAKTFYWHFPYVNVTEK